ncbi:unnamed protein product [Zymoseptoria tritici ST99CH_1A5]|uniref:Uncharacterized protein n=1 Tax=Zymoseptoria tritici ST99CH_1A5 TaxID=1276529 RepID=A0A1Y6LP77_ZYMTR|nr:unnamed protein product [Zymoseptoria tritici ST99CH_3D1]SMY26105.1 unnamed protein product [Zymoseptoria tritici ST99CH_1A5]
MSYQSNQDIPPPPYSSSLPPVITPKPSSTPRSCREYLFLRGNGLTTKPKLRLVDSNTSHVLDASIHRTKPSTIKIHLDASIKSPCLGALIFPATHNDFQIHTADPHHATSSSPNPNSLIQVKARIGQPHPATYSFTLPATPSTRARRLVWTMRKSSSPKPVNVSYTLTEESTNEVLAYWTTVQGEKYSAMLRWYVPAMSDREEMLVMLSFLGCLTRLQLKGKEGFENGNGLARWSGMWFMAVLGTAAVA